MTMIGTIRSLDSRARRGQTVQLLARLERGSATRDELRAIAPSYRGRIAELRARGYAILCDRSDPTQPRYTLLGKRAVYGNLELL